MVASKRYGDLYWFRPELECSEVLIMEGARMVEEVGEL
jgi:hypothetical protein